MIDQLIEFVSGISLIQVLLVIGFVMGVLEVYIKKSDTEYDSQARVLYNILFAVYSVLVRDVEDPEELGGDSDGAEGGDFDGE